MTEVDVAIVGGGVAGLATAAEIALAGKSVCVLERHPRVGMETSTHNSGVIHAGLYYPPGSLKARLCVEGRDRLYAFCAAHGVPHRRTGKLVLASDHSEIPALEALFHVGRTNGVELEMVDGAFVRAREPHAHAGPALWSPSTGIVSAETLVHTLRSLAASRDVAILPGTPLMGAEVRAGAVVLSTPREEIAAALVINAAGLYADEVSALMGGESFRIYPARGEYAELVWSKRAMVNGLIYPVPHKPGHSLGVHIVPSVDGAVLIGPTIRYQEDKDDYEKDRLALEDFLEPATRLLPAVSLADLRLGGSGIRAKLCPPTESFADFMIRFDTRVPNLFHVAGIDSPGLTSCLAIAREVARAIG